MSPHGFDEVLAAARLGQPWALTALYRAYAGPVTGYVRLRTPAEPEDVVSDVFLSAFGALERFRGGESDFRGWLFTIAARRVVDDLRRRGRQVPTTAYDPADDVRAAPAAEEAALDALGAAWARSVLDRLAPDQREVLLLRVLGDLTVDQVADRLGKTRGAVKQLQRRGLAACARILAAEGVPLDGPPTMPWTT
jgi:RNA polymerase sigma factor (sigma-70 family)